MNRSELIKSLAEECDITNAEASRIVKTFFQSMREAIKNGNRIEIRGFGSFKVKEYKSYKGRNPKTGEVVNVASKKLPFFRAGKEFKDYLNS